MLHLKESHRVNIYNGNHGLGRYSLHERREKEDYLRWAEWSGIGEEWVKEITNLSLRDDREGCGVSIVWAEDLDAANYQYYRGGFVDLKSTDWGGWGYYYIDGCDPEWGREL